ncbi:hypothetical protein [Burkholderia cenocepacia]|nr:hypothetical protein [Burkholderia cenocepacia]
MNKPMPFWKIVLLWLAVGIGCVAWTQSDEARAASSASTYSA